MSFISKLFRSRPKIHVPNEQEDFESTREKLKAWDLKNTPKFGAHGKYLAFCPKVYDGDTITLIFFENKNSSTPISLSCRMLSYDTPELAKAKTSEEKKEGLRSKKVMQSLVLNKFVVASFSDKKEKYGRILKQYFLLTFKGGLVKIWIGVDGLETFQDVEGYDVPITYDMKSMNTEDGLLVNNWMIENVICSQYYGKTKKTFEEMRDEFSKKRKNHHDSNPEDESHDSKRHHKISEINF